MLIIGFADKIYVAAGLFSLHDSLAVRAPDQPGKNMHISGVFRCSSSFFQKALCLIKGFSFDNGFVCIFYGRPFFLRYSYLLMDLIADDLGSSLYHISQIRSVFKNVINSHCAPVSRAALIISGIPIFVSFVLFIGRRVWYPQLI